VLELSSNPKTCGNPLNTPEDPPFWGPLGPILEDILSPPGAFPWVKGLLLKPPLDLTGVKPTPGCKKSPTLFVGPNGGIISKTPRGSSQKVSRLKTNPSQLEITLDINPVFHRNSGNAK